MEHWMNTKTGTVDTAENWQADAAASVGTEGAWDFYETCGAGGLVMVRKNKAGAWVEIPAYCAQNDGDCLSCSLVSYGRDCENLPVA